MTIKVGQKLPKGTLLVKQADGRIEPVDMTEKLAGRKVALVGVPGAFTGTCTGEHLPGLIKAAPALAENGVDEIIVFAANDPSVMEAWGQFTGATEAGLTLLCDPTSKFIEALGLRFDAEVVGLIGRCLRFSALINDGVIETLNFEEERGVCDLTSGDTLLKALL